MSKQYHSQINQLKFWVFTSDMTRKSNKLNWTTKTDKRKQLINNWKLRNLTYYGKSQ